MATDRRGCTPGRRQGIGKQRHPGDPVSSPDRATRGLHGRPGHRPRRRLLRRIRLRGRRGRARCCGACRRPARRMGEDHRRLAAQGHRTTCELLRGGPGQGGRGRSRRRTQGRHPHDGTRRCAFRGGLGGRLDRARNVPFRPGSGGAGRPRRRLGADRAQHRVPPRVSRSRQLGRSADAGWFGQSQGAPPGSGAAGCDHPGRDRSGRTARQRCRRGGQAPRVRAIRSRRRHRGVNGRL